MKNISGIVSIIVAVLLVAFLVISSRMAPKNAVELTTANAIQRRLSDEDALAIAQKYPEAQSTPSGLRYSVHTLGDGQPAQRGKRLTVHYTGSFLSGEVFDSSRERGQPFVFTLGVDRVIEGWVEGVGMMKKGERRTLIIPYWLGYGEAGKGSKIPPKATLIFDVEILDIQ